MSNGNIVATTKTVAHNTQQKREATNQFKNFQVEKETDNVAVDWGAAGLMQLIATYLGFF